MHPMGAARFVCLSFLAACGGGGGFPDAKQIDAAPTGTFSATWSVVDQNSAPLACERISAQTMTVLAHNKAFDGGSTQIFTCGTGMGTSQAMIAGTYDFDFELGGTFGAYGRAPSQLSVAIPPNVTTPLAPFTFMVQATGAIELKFDTQKSGGNCGATGSGGAGITGVTITMNHVSDTTCAPLQLTISDGARPGAGGSYTINCNTPTTFGCIENDQTITASNISSDGYTMHIKGFIGANACWLNSDMIAVPPLDKTLQKTLNLTQQTTSGC